MNERDFTKTSIKKGSLASGDIIRSVNGKTYRTVLLADDSRVVVEGRNGNTDSLPYDAICRHWVKMTPLPKE